jgi:hypothetical protein
MMLKATPLRACCAGCRGCQSSFRQRMGLGVKTIEDDGALGELGCKVK